MNERFLMSPSINKTITLRSALSLTAKSSGDNAPFAFLQSPLLGISSSPKPVVPAEEKRSERKPSENKLIPFDIDEHHLPHFLMARVVTHQRRWFGAPNKIVFSYFLTQI